MAPVLNRKLTLEAPVRAPDGAGGFSESWQALGTLWAEIKAGSGRETAGNSGTLSRLPLKITVRAAPVGSGQRPEVNQRFVEGSRIYRILAVAERDASARFLICNALEEVAA